MTKKQDKGKILDAIVKQFEKPIRGLAKWIEKAVDVVLDSSIPASNSEKDALQFVIDKLVLVENDLNDGIDVTLRTNSSNSLKTYFSINGIESCLFSTIANFHNDYFKQPHDSYYDAMLFILNKELNSMFNNNDVNLVSNLKIYCDITLPHNSNKKLNAIANIKQVDKKKLDPNIEIIAFADDREDVKYPEQNTAVEDELTSNLKRHFMDNRGISTSTAKYLQKLKSQGKYPDVFADPKKPIIYRGMAISDDNLKKLLKNKKEADRLIKLIDSKKIAKSEVNLIFKPRGGMNVSSWTTSKRMAWEFAEDAATYKDHLIILYADATEDLHKKFSGEDGLYKITDMGDEFAHEKEVMCIGQVKVYAIEIKGKSYQGL